MKSLFILFVLAMQAMMAYSSDPPTTETYHIEIPLKLGEKGKLVSQSHEWSVPATPKGLEHIAVALVGGDLKLLDPEGNEIGHNADTSVRFHSGLVKRIHVDGEVNGEADDAHSEYQCSTHTLMAHHAGMEQTRFKEPYFVRVDEEQPLEFVMRVLPLSSAAPATVTVRYSLRVATLPLESSDYKFVHPVFLPVGGCKASDFSIKSSGSDYHYEFSDALMPFDGKTVYSLGFLEQGGDNIYLQHRQNGRVVYSGDAVYEDNMLTKVSYAREEMNIKPGDSLRIAAVYKDQDVPYAFGYVMLYVRGSAFDDEVVVSRSRSGFQELDEADPGPSWFERAGLPIAVFVILAVMLVCIGFGLASGAVRAKRARFDADLEEEREKELEERRSISMEVARNPFPERGSTTVFEARSTSLDEDMILPSERDEPEFSIE